MGVLSGLWAVGHIMGGPHVKTVDSHGRIQISSHTKEVRPVCKTRNQFVRKSACHPSHSCVASLMTLPRFCLATISGRRNQQVAWWGASLQVKILETTG